MDREDRVRAARDRGRQRRIVHPGSFRSGMKRRIQHGNALEILLAQATRRQYSVGHCLLNEVDTGFFKDEGGISDRFGTVGSHSDADGSERETEKRSPIDRHCVHQLLIYSVCLCAR